MDIKTLRYFLTVAEEKSFSKAAERMHMSQPPLSKQIAQLESELGIQLLIRGKGVELTEAGEFLKARAAELIAAFELTEQQIKEFSDGSSGHIKLGAVESITRSYLPKYIEEFNKQFPKVSFWLHSTHNIDQIMLELDKGVYDFAFVRKPFDSRKYNEVEVTKDCWGVLIPKNHHLAMTSMDYITADMLRNEKMTVSTAKNRAIMGWFSDNGINPNIVCWWDSLIAAEKLVMNDTGLCIVLSSYDSLNPNLNVVYKKLYPRMESSIYIVWKKERALTGVGKLFLEYVKSQI